MSDEDVRVVLRSAKRGPGPYGLVRVPRQARAAVRRKAEALGKVREEGNKWTVDLNTLAADRAQEIFRNSVEIALLKEAK